jgi:hypothetical protein
MARRVLSFPKLTVSPSAGRTLTRVDASDTSQFVGGRWAGWQREFDVAGGTSPPGYEIMSRERVDGAVLERTFTTPDERSTSIVDLGQLVTSDEICVFDDDDRASKNEWHLRTTFKSAEGRVRVTLRTTSDGLAVSPRKPRVRIAVESCSDCAGPAPCWATDSFVASEDGDSVCWFPGDVELRFDGGVVRIAYRSMAVERRFDANSRDLLDLRFAGEYFLN